MNTARISLSSLRPILGGLLVAVLVGTSALVFAPPAQAADSSTVTGGHAAWGYKASFRGYVGNQAYASPPESVLPAGQRITVANGAEFDPAGTPAAVGNPETRPYLFPVTGGTVTDEQNLDITAQGTVAFRFPSHCFEAVVGNPRVIVSGGVATLRGTLSVTVSNSNPVLCASYPEPVTTGGADVLIGAATADVAIAGDGTSATVALTGLALSAAGATAMQGFANEGDLLDNLSLAAQLQAPESQAPAVVVSQTANLDPLGDTVTVSGSGFLPNPPDTNAARQPLAPGFGGVYVAFGKFQDVWQPSTDAPSSARKTGDTKWAVPHDKVGVVGGAARGAIVLEEDGTFSTELVIDKSVVDAVSTGNYGIYTYAGGGALYAGFETFTPISFAPLATAIAFTAAPASQVTEGGLVTLRAVLESPVPGTVAFTDGATVLGTVPADAAGVAEIVVPSLPVGVHTILATFTPEDPAAFATSTASIPYTVNAKIVAAGSLTWGFKQSFRSYVAGSVAKGSITTTGVGGSGGAFVFGQASGGTFNGATGTSNYTGSVRFLGHEGILDLTLANPVVRIDSSQSATLLLNVNGSGGVPFASLNLAVATKSTVNGAVSYSGVPAVLTAQGASAFTYNGGQFYPAGTTLDSLSFVIGSASSGGGATRTVAAFVSAPELPSAPPATTGLELDPDSLESLQAGSEITVTGEGFEPNETGIRVVIYSEPIVLDENVTADASGTATWTGRLPAELVGEHTLTLQGSVARGIVLDIPARLQMAAIPGCPVDGADLTWGFKDTFRSYVSGTIANGEWTTAGGATYATPDFSWSSGVGNFDGTSGEGLVGFTGSITFTGHGGILNTTVANPQVRLDGNDSAVLLLDVSGTTQDGAVIEQRGVEFATVDLSAAARTGEGSVVTFTGAPTVLLESGADAFGTYPAGEPLDPITLSFTMTPECGPIAAENPVEPVAGADSSWPLWLAGGIVVLALLSLLAVWMVRRRTA